MNIQKNTMLSCLALVLMQLHTKKKKKGANNAHKRCAVYGKRPFKPHRCRK